MFEQSIEKVRSLLSPQNVVIVGASERPGSWGWRVWRNLYAHQYPNSIYPLNPNRDRVWGVRCYATFDDLPERPDHLAVFLPAQRVPDILISGAVAGARSATIFSVGFGEGSSAEGDRLRDELRGAIETSGIAVSGPNCVGNLNTRTRCVTLIEDRQHKLEGGPIALVGQSGGAIMFLKRCLEERGMRVDCVVTSGNEVDLTAADYIAYFASQADLKVIITYLEHINEAPRLKAAARLAQNAGKTIIAYKIGRSDAGRKAALAHTGALAGSVDAFDAAFLSAGIVRVDSLDEAIELSELLMPRGTLAGCRIGAVTVSGAFCGMLLDSAERFGVLFPRLEATTRAELSSILGEWSYGGNPIDGGYGIVTNPDNLSRCINALNSDPNIDVILVQGVLPSQPGMARIEKYISLCREYADTPGSKPLAFVSFASYGLTDYSHEVRAGANNISFLQEINKTLSAVGRLGASIRERTLRMEADAAAATACSDRGVDKARCAEIFSSRAGRMLSEPDAKRLLAAYGISSPEEVVVQDEDDVLPAARQIGFPVVLKLISSQVLHKSDIGGVHLNLQSDQQVLQAFKDIQAVAAKRQLKTEGVLVSKFIEGGTELALGIHRDPDVGHVVMLAQGGTMLEVIKDVQLRAPPISKAMALHMVNSLRCRDLLYGFRGSEKADVESLCHAIMQVGWLADEWGSMIESIDVNPLVVLAQGCLALDAAVVLKDVSN